MPAWRRCNARLSRGRKKSVEETMKDNTSAAREATKRLVTVCNRNNHLAQDKAVLTAARAECESVVIICFQIRNAAIESLNHTMALQRIYWPSPEWKQLIWYFRKGKHLPSHLAKYRDALLVIGTISTKGNTSYTTGLRLGNRYRKGMY